ncbi:MAG: spermidine/putrescine ABC transporter substrate-binding protein [Actinobacteria bacterium]|nr:spermidine/putrescine ABC transporter substrate-binding protein [Actinomycetota bacterium]
MTHPRERLLSTRLSRRDFLRTSAGTAFALSGAGALLAACAKESGGGGGGGGQEGIHLASRDNPVTLPLFDDIPPIADGLSPEPGPLRIYNWNDYIYKKVLKKFQDEFGVAIEYTQFTGMSEAISKVQSGAVDFDLFFPTIENLSKLVAAKFLQPLNHTYLTNWDANVWPRLKNPYYDQGSRYTVPYLTWKTGIGYRNDFVDDPAALAMPFDVFWDPKYKGKVGLLDEYRETIGMALVRNGEDMNSTDPAAIAAAGDSLKELIDLVNVEVSPGDYQKLAEGTSWVRYSWSGNINYARYYLPKGTPVDVLGYYYPPTGGWEVSNDLIVISRNAKNPVLAHMFINFLYDIDNGLTNFGYEGYQPPFVGVSDEEFMQAGYIPENLSMTLVRESDFETGVPILPVIPEVDQLYQDAWAEFKSGV